MTLQSREVHEISKLLIQRTRLFWWLIIAICVLTVMIGVTVLQLGKLTKQGQEVSLRNQQYIRCLADAFVKSQDQKITALDLDRCTTQTKDNPSPAPLPSAADVPAQVPQVTEPQPKAQVNPGSPSNPGENKPLLNLPIIGPIL